MSGTAMSSDDSARYLSDDCDVIEKSRRQQHRIRSQVCSDHSSVAAMSKLLRVQRTLKRTSGLIDELSRSGQFVGT
jgi:hypothetical protein